MAYGTRCIQCGFQESSHYDGETEGCNPSIPQEGFQHSLRSCKGFESSDPETEFLNAIGELKWNIRGYQNPEDGRELTNDIARDCNFSDRLMASDVAIRIGATYERFKHLLH